MMPILMKHNQINGICRLYWLTDSLNSWLMSENLRYGIGKLRRFRENAARSSWTSVSLWGSWMQTNIYYFQLPFLPKIRSLRVYEWKLSNKLWKVSVRYSAYLYACDSVSECVWGRKNCFRCFLFSSFRLSIYTFIHLLIHLGSLIHSLFFFSLLPCFFFIPLCRVTGTLRVRIILCTLISKL